jgi:transposase
MKLHAKRQAQSKGRPVMWRRVVEQARSLAEAAEAAGVSERTCSKWVERYRAEGEAGVFDRSSAPEGQPNRTPEQRVEAIARLRRLRFTGQEIALTLGMALSTVSGILALNKAKTRVVTLEEGIDFLGLGSTSAATAASR